MIKLVIKCDPGVAATIARNRHVQLSSVQGTLRTGETLAMCGSGELEHVCAWFMSPQTNNPPYPIGTLLWYAVV